MRADITVDGRPDWLFIKLHCHGMDPRDESSMIGEAAQGFMRDLIGWAQDNSVNHLHFVTGREMVNIALAAADGNEGNPSDYRDYYLQPQLPQAATLADVRGSGYGFAYALLFSRRSPGSIWRVDRSRSGNGIVPPNAAGRVQPAAWES